MIYKLAIALCLTTAGFAAGGLLGVLLFQDAGPAAGPSVAAVAIACAIVGLAGGVYAAIRVPPERLGTAAAASCIAAAGAIGAVFARKYLPPERPVAYFEEPAGGPAPPPPPAPGARDSLFALATARPEILAMFESKEVDYEEPAVAIYGEAPGFYLVVRASSDRRTWVRSDEFGAMHRIERLLPNRLNYLTDAWDGSVRGTPARSAPAAPVNIERKDHGAHPANVLEAQATADGTWILVEVLDSSPCEGGVPKVVSKGWVPLWGVDARPTAWFFSRGC